jgi:hypothetical protein
VTVAQRAPMTTDEGARRAEARDGAGRRAATERRVVAARMEAAVGFLFSNEK